nr:MAG TPA: hypothetical protein [Caudoviricetes sp.]
MAKPFDSRTASHRREDDCSSTGDAGISKSLFS